MTSIKAWEIIHYGLMGCTEAEEWCYYWVQSPSHVCLFVTPWTAARQASLSITNSWNLLKLMSIEWVMPSNHLIPVTPFSIFPSIRVFSSESVLHIRWPKYRSFSFRISPSNEYSRLISFRIDWMDLLAVQGTLSVTELSVKCLYVQNPNTVSPRNTNFNLQTFKEVNMPSMMRKWELLPRHHWVIFSKR